jgi:hypothetical protein
MTVRAALEAVLAHQMIKEQAVVDTVEAVAVLKTIMAVAADRTIAEPIKLI